MTSLGRACVVSFLAVFAAGARAQPEGPGLLIVAPEALAETLAPFVAFKAQRLPTRLVTLETMLADSPGADDPERLKHAIYDFWRGGNFAHVLLVGDADVMPVRYMVLDRNTEPAFNYAFYPSDLYYADLAKPDGSFEPWNAQADDFHALYFGEVRGEHFKNDPINYDRVDYRPEIGVGRWPVSTPEAALLVAEKSMRYERAVEDAREHPRPGAWPDRAGLVMVGGWVDARPQFERVSSALAGRFDIARRYYDGDAYHAEAPTAESVVALLGSGVGLLIHAGHGSDTTWHECIGVSNLPQIDNADRLAVVMSAGCSTARFAPLPPYEAYEDIQGRTHAGTDAGEVFDAPPPPPACYARGDYNRTGLGEQMLVAGPGGAVAYIGCNTGSQPCALTLVQGFAEAAGSLDNPSLGACWKHALATYFEREHLDTIEPTESWYPASIFFQGMKFMLFGDPSLPVGTAR
jgi:hypothetical protein